MSGEISCNNCVAACCKGPLIMSLNPEEYAAMSQAGNTLLTVAAPVDYDREQVPYPVAIQINEERGTRQFLAENGREYEPLSAGLGRYMLLGTCKNLVTSPHGLELCAIYETRPAVCREFEVGSKKCEVLRILHKVDDA